MRAGVVPLIVALMALLSNNSAALSQERENPDDPRYAELAQYTRSLLLKLFPSDSQMIRHVAIVILPDTVEPNAWARDDTLTISYSLIGIVGREEKYIFVLDHEFGHLKLGHVRTEKSDWFMTQIDFALREKQEIAADSFALDAMRRQGYSPCIGYRLINKGIRFSGARWNPADPENAILLKRESLLAEICHEEERRLSPP